VNLLLCFSAPPPAGEGESNPHWVFCSRYVLLCLAHLLQCLEKLDVKHFHSAEDARLLFDTTNQLLLKAEMVYTSHKAAWYTVYILYIYTHASRKAAWYTVYILYIYTHASRKAAWYTVYILYIYTHASRKAAWYTVYILYIYIHASRKAAWYRVYIFYIYIHASHKADSNISLWYIKIIIEQVSSIHNCKVNRTSFIIARLPA